MNAAGSIILDKQGWMDAGIESVEFEDGTILDQFQVAALLVDATSGDDSLTGTLGNDEIWALEGDDTVTGQPGDDSLFGQDGIDTLVGGEGVDQLHGGAGYDFLHGDTASEVVPVGTNLLINGGFEQSGTIVSSGSWGQANSWLPGWSKTNAQSFEQVYSGIAGITSEGNFWLDLDSAGGAGSNMEISQTVSDLSVGQVVLLQFDHANRTSVSSGAFEVYWNGALVAAISETGAVMQTKTYELTAVEGDNIIAFKGIGSTDNSGAALDNVRLFQTLLPTGGDDVLTGGEGNDFLDGGAGTDTAQFSGAQSDYQVIVSGDSVSVIDINLSDGDEGTDELLDIETLLFAGGEAVLLGSQSPTAPEATFVPFERSQMTDLYSRPGFGDDFWMNCQIV